MSQPAQHYANSARAGMSPRESEASALVKAAARLQLAAEREVPGNAAFEAALTHNRKLWTVILSSVSRPESELPPELRGAVLTLANFVLNHTIATTAAPDAAKLACLIGINRDLAAGLRGQA